MSKSEGGRGKLIRDPGVKIIPVHIRIALGLGPQVESGHELTSEDERKPLFVDDVLVLRDDDSPRFLEDILLSPMPIQSLKSSGYPIMFSHPNCVHHYQI